MREACRARDWELGEQACDIAAAATLETLASARARIGVLNRRLGTMTPKRRPAQRR